MELTEMQVDAVADEVNDMLKGIFYNNRDREEVIDLILDDVVQDIEETADWNNYAHKSKKAYDRAKEKNRKNFDD